MPTPIAQPTPAELVRQIVADDPRPLYRIETQAGLPHGILRLWLQGTSRPRTDLLIALANTCGAEIVARRDGDR